MSYDIIDIADLDVIYLSFDEPQKEEYWLKIKNMVPWAKRVDGVKGSDAAHKAAGEASDTDRFILIDGDNLPDEEFFNLQLDFTGKDERFKQAQFRWRAKNAINGLRYGNGGISSWTKEYVANMRTHENQTDGDLSKIADFCTGDGEGLYFAMHDCYSTTYPNYTPFQAWRAGFREGVKMCLDQGKLPSVDQFKETVAKRNLDNLKVWHNVGADVENGLWAIYGARLGTYTTMLTDWDHTQVHWFENYLTMWEEHKDQDPEIKIKVLGFSLEDKLGLPVDILNPQQSKFFKYYYGIDKRNLGPLVTEIRRD
jgi:hypothetical protein